MVQMEVWSHTKMGGDTSYNSRGNGSESSGSNARHRDSPKKEVAPHAHRPSAIKDRGRTNTSSSRDEGGAARPAVRFSAAPRSPRRNPSLHPPPPPPPPPPVDGSPMSHFGGASIISDASSWVMSDPAHTLFAEDGHVLSEKERLKLRSKSGMCPKCGTVRTHERVRRGLNPLARLGMHAVTERGKSYKGVCLRCHGGLCGAKTMLGEKVTDEDRAEDERVAQKKDMSSKMRAIKMKAKSKVQARGSIQLGKGASPSPSSDILRQSAKSATIQQPRVPYPGMAESTKDGIVASTSPSSDALRQSAKSETIQQPRLPYPGVAESTKDGIAPQLPRYDRGEDLETLQRKSGPDPTPNYGFSSDDGDGDGDGSDVNSVDAAVPVPPRAMANALGGHRKSISLDSNFDLPRSGVCVKFRKKKPPQPTKDKESYQSQQKLEQAQSRELHKQVKQTHANPGSTSSEFETAKLQPKEITQRQLDSHNNDNQKYSAATNDKNCVSLGGACQKDGSRALSDLEVSHDDKLGSVGSLSYSNQTHHDVDVIHSLNRYLGSHCMDQMAEGSSGDGKRLQDIGVEVELRNADDLDDDGNGGGGISYREVGIDVMHRRCSSFDVENRGSGLSSNSAVSCGMREKCSSDPYLSRSIQSLESIDDHVDFEHQRVKMRQERLAQLFVENEDATLQSACADEKAANEHVGGDGSGCRVEHDRLIAYGSTRCHQGTAISRSQKEKLRHGAAFAADLGASADDVPGMYPPPKVGTWQTNETGPIDLDEFIDDHASILRAAPKPQHTNTTDKHVSAGVISEMGIQRPRLKNDDYVRDGGNQTSLPMNPGGSCEPAYQTGQTSSREPSFEKRWEEALSRMEQKQALYGEQPGSVRSMPTQRSGAWVDGKAKVPSEVNAGRTHRRSQTDYSNPDTAHGDIRQHNFLHEVLEEPTSSRRSHHDRVRNRQAYPDVQRAEVPQQHNYFHEGPDESIMSGRSHHQRVTHRQAYSDGQWANVPRNERLSEKEIEYKERLALMQKHQAESGTRTRKGHRSHHSWDGRYTRSVQQGPVDLDLFDDACATPQVERRSERPQNSRYLFDHHEVSPSQEESIGNLYSF